MKRVMITDDPFPIDWDKFYTEIPILPCRWISCRDADRGTPVTMSFRLDFTADEDESIVVHVSADQQYLLWLDGEFVGRGCEMKSPENWYFESYELSLVKGQHRLEAFAWNYGALSPDNRMSLAPGFILIPDAAHLAMLGTGVAGWKAKPCAGTSFSQLPQQVLGVYITAPPYESRDCREYFKNDAPTDWMDPVMLSYGIDGFLRKDESVHCLVPSAIERLHSGEIAPARAVYIAETADPGGYMPAENTCREEPCWPIVVPPHAVKRIVFDLEEYYCGYVKLKVRDGRGGQIRATWAEAAFTDAEAPAKSDRAGVAGKYLRGVWDEFILDGEPRELTPLAWRSGRFVELTITAAAAPVTVDDVTILETRYPLEPVGGFVCDQSEVNEIIPLCIRTMQVTAHDNFVDCPYYEQLPYTGDGRLEALANLVTCHDDTLVRKMLTLFAGSRDLSGFTMCCWPRTARCVIPSFSLAWIGMVYDYALWRDDRSLVASLLPAMRGLLDTLLSRMDTDGFLRGVRQEWNFIDWVDEWAYQVCTHTPPSIVAPGNATYNWLFVYTLGLARQLEDYAGDPFLAARWDSIAADLAGKLPTRFWDEDKKIFKDEDSGQFYSEHTQILAALSGRLPESCREGVRSSLVSPQGLATCSIYYKHYLFEACRQLELPERILTELALWHSFVDRGFKTSPETPENKTFNQRSDCHGWGAHPLYHLIANIAGIQPAGMGFTEVVIAPMLGDLSDVDARCVHPDGIIHAAYTRKPDALHCRVSLPATLSGQFRYGGSTRPLTPGEHSFTIKQ